MTPDAPGKAQQKTARIDLDRLYAAMDERSMDGYAAAWQAPLRGKTQPVLDRLRRLAAKGAGRRP